MLGDDEVEALLPLLQPSAMSRQVRHALGKPKPLLTSLRARAAACIGTPEPELTELRRVSPTNIAMAAGAAFGVYLLLGELSSVASVGDVFSNPAWGWIAALSSCPKRHNSPVPSPCSVPLPHHCRSDR